MKSVVVVICFLAALVGCRSNSHTPGRFTSSTNDYLYIDDAPYFIARYENSTNTNRYITPFPMPLSCKSVITGEKDLRKNHTLPYGPSNTTLFIFPESCMPPMIHSAWLRFRRPIIGLWSNFSTRLSDKKVCNNLTRYFIRTIYVPQTGSAGRYMQNQSETPKRSTLPGSMNLF